MVFRNFRFQVIVRAVLMVAAITITTWCLVHHYYLRSVYAGVAVVLIVGEFIWYVDRFNRDVRSFMISLQQHDFTTHFQSTGRSKSFDELYATLNKISEVFRAISAEKETQFRFLEMLVEHLRVGIFSMDESGKIVLANQALKELLQKEVIFSLKSLENYDPILVNTIREIHGGETRLIKLRIRNELLQLSIHASEFKLEEHYHKLISMQNIRNELDAREMEAWQKLIRVLTHEIMNSVSPIISLSETMHGLVVKNNETLVNQDGDLFNTLDKGLDAIKLRSEGLYNFTQSYRKLTGIPKLVLKETTLRELISRVATLMESKLREKGIAFKVTVTDQLVSLDPELMEHVLINLVQNAIDALAGRKDPVIRIGSRTGDRGEVEIFVADNGEGIDEATGEKIFIPFFTTRKNGSGIGLALAKQILHLHHADITYVSTRGEGTEFIVRL